MARNPDASALRLTLAKALAASGRAADALAGLETACEEFPADEALRRARAASLARHGRVDCALAVAAGSSDKRWAAPFALNLLAEHGRYAEASLLEDEVAVAAPADIGLLECRARRLRGDPQALLRIADAALAAQPGMAHAFYYRAVALAQLGRSREAAETMAIDRFLRVSPLPTPSGYRDTGAFLAALRCEILGNPTLHPDPAAHTTRHGLRTLAFPAASDAAAAAVLDGIRRAIETYALGLEGDHDFVRARPERVSLTAWAIVLRGPGHQQLHHHPRPWLTGVFYVSAPEGTPRPGTIRIGPLPAWAGIDPPWGVREIEPEPGTLLIFPSFVPHETVATGSDDERISVAFDVNAAGA